MNSTKGWVSEPEGRGTLGLLWSCLFTVFVCSWSAVHPNLPAAKDSEWVILRRRTGYMLLSITAPELLCSFAVADWFKARAVRSKFSPRLTMRQSFFLAAGGFAVKTKSGKVLRCGQADLLKLDRAGVISLRQTDDKELDDKNKASWFSKSIALIQILWFGIQLLGRAIQKLPISTLELFTMGMVATAVISYFFWWEKLFDVKTPIILTATPQGPDYAWPEEVERIGLMEDAEEQQEIIWIIVGCATILFGACHIIGWDFQFPTPTEKLLWRITSLMCGILPFPTIVALVYYDELNTVKDKLLLSTIIIAILLYILGRLYMFVEMFTSLRAAPAGLYQTPQWSQYFPHI